MKSLSVRMKVTWGESMGRIDLHGVHDDDNKTLNGPMAYTLSP